MFLGCLFLCRNVLDFYMLEMLLEIVTNMMVYEVKP